MMAFYAGLALGFAIGWIFCAMITVGQGRRRESPPPDDWGPRPLPTTDNRKPKTGAQP